MAILCLKLKSVTIMREYLLHRDVAKKYRENVLMINKAELICETHAKFSFNVCIVIVGFYLIVYLFLK